MVGPTVQASLCAIARVSPAMSLIEGNCEFFYEFEILQILEVP